MKTVCELNMCNGCNLDLFNEEVHLMTYHNILSPGAIGGYGDFYVNKLGFSVIRENYRPEREDWKLDLRVNEHTGCESQLGRMVAL